MAHSYAESDVGVTGGSEEQERDEMSKKGRKRRSRKKSNANHGKRPNA